MHNTELGHDNARRNDNAVVHSHGTALFRADIDDQRGQYTDRVSSEQRDLADGKSGRIERLEQELCTTLIHVPGYRRRKRKHHKVRVLRRLHAEALHKDMVPA